MFLWKTQRAHLLSWWGVRMDAKHKYKSTQIQAQLALSCRERTKVMPMRRAVGQLSSRVPFESGFQLEWAEAAAGMKS